MVAEFATPGLEWLAWAYGRAQAHLLADSALREYAKLGSVLAVTFLLEVAARKNWRFRYGSRNFRIDFLYYVFYYSGLYHVLFFAWIYTTLTGLVTRYAPWLQLNLLSGMSPAMQLAVLILAADFIGYWAHRARHSNRFLWCFHRVHHSQTILTAVTNYRFHIVDETVLRLWLFIPFQVLGPGLEVWLLADFVMAWILLVQHSDWKWSYGRLGLVVVSPMFHRLHHSREERLQNRNFAMLFSFWDDLFGTSERRAPYPERLGLAGDPVPETLWGQLVEPFEEFARQWRGLPDRPVAAGPATRDAVE